MHESSGKVALMVHYDTALNYNNAQL